MALSLKQVWFHLTDPVKRHRHLAPLDLTRLPDRDFADLRLPEQIEARERQRRLSAMGMGRW